MKYVLNAFLIILIPSIFILLYNSTNNIIFIFLFILSLILDIIYLISLIINFHKYEKNIFEKLEELIENNKYLILKGLKTKEESEKEIKDFIYKNYDTFLKNKENIEKQNIFMRQVVVSTLSKK